MNNTQDIGASFQKLLQETFFVYKGLRFEKTSAGYVHNGVLCRNHHEMDLLVEQEKQALVNSLDPDTSYSKPLYTIR